MFTQETRLNFLVYANTSHICEVIFSNEAVQCQQYSHIVQLVLISQ